ncbi:hypothetical protein QTG54_016093 [Skeletonema marinoi]|uniref:Leucine-rich repeat domain-containing protein n=1 Tax=Skeletonema marinoi TaxID=267567 RepID=A0AAD8XSW7_9STRA|nr:hypothetical protein QTG54_016093 [Skeletonema marinoi]
MMAAEEYYIYTGGVVPRHVTRVRIDKSITVIPARAFQGHPNITELDCHDKVEKVEESAFYLCRSLRRVIMPGVKVVDQWAFWKCEALTIVECGKLERIRGCAFSSCISLRNINLPSIKIVEGSAFCWCKALMTVKFGDKLKTLNGRALYGCRALERIAIPLKDGMITHDNIITGCEKMKHVDLVEEELHETIAALLLEEWKKDMRRKIDALNQILDSSHYTCRKGRGCGGEGRCDTNLDHKCSTQYH